jgi:hypothetical protein
VSGIPKLIFVNESGDVITAEGRAKVRLQIVLFSAAGDA